MEKLAKEVVEALIKANKKIAFAESLTGGLIAQTFVSVSGASNVFGYGFVTYSDEAKCHMLGVAGDCISEHGAVSAECASQMAEGAYKISGADMAVSVTGFAGPANGDEYEPVGTVFMGICIDGSTTVSRLYFDGDRQNVRTKTAEAVFFKLRDILL